MLIKWLVGGGKMLIKWFPAVIKRYLAFTTAK